MYEKFFGLQRTPFPVVPDPDCLHLTGQHADVVSGAVFGVRERKGFVVLTGEAGLGKTTAIRAITEMLARYQAQISIISHPTLNASDFLELTMLNFGLPAVSDSKAQRLKVLENFLLDADAAGKISVLIVDEAHNLPAEALEEIRLLGNLTTDKHKLLQILLVGQNELNARLDMRELWQLKQRISLRLSLSALNRNGVQQYIAFRWSKAGGYKLPFDTSAMEAIAAWSLGIPRVIHAICDNALLLALSEGTREIGVEQIQLACEDLQLATPRLRRSAPVAVPPLAMESTSEGWGGEAPRLVRKAAVGGAAADAVPPKSASQDTASAAAAEPAVKPEDALVAESSAPSTPSRWKKWRGLLEPRGGDKSAADLSFKRRL